MGLMLSPGGVYSDSSNITVGYNKITDCPSPLTFEESSDLTFYNNIIMGTGDSNVNDWGGCTGTVKIYNNVMVKNNRHASLNLGSTGATYIVKNNIIDGGEEALMKIIFIPGLAGVRIPAMAGR
jgi:hypothetical protein